MRKRRERVWMRRRCLAGGLAVGMLAGAAAGALPGTVSAEEADGTAMGRYLESEVTLPADDGSLDIQGIVRLEDGRLRLIGDSTQLGEAMWDSSDGGETWELAASLPPEYGSVYFTDLALCADGGGTGIIMFEEGAWPGDEASGESAGEAEAAGTGSEDELSGESAGEAEATGTDGEDESSGESASEEGAAEVDGENKSSGGSSSGAALADYAFAFVSFDADGNTQRTPCTISDMATLRFSRSGDLLWMTPGGDVHLADRVTGESLMLLDSETRMIGTSGSEAILLKKNGLQRYDMATGEPITRDDVLEETLYAGGATYEVVSSSGYPITFTEDEEGRLYYCTEEGIFSHIMGGSVVEQIVDGNLNSLRDLESAVLSFEIADQSFYVIYTGEMGVHGLLKYTYNTDISTVPDKTLTVYSLYENSGMRQTAVLFQKAHPEVYVNYEIGVSGADGVTASDALRTLNTEILAGEGPDLLILDGMSAETYIRNGVLTDLSGILTEIQDKDGLLEQIAYTYETDGEVPAVPVQFGIPMAVGEAELIEQLDDLASLNAVQKDKVLGMTNVVCLPETLYAPCAASWRREDGTIDEDGLAEFVHIMKEIYSEYCEMLDGDQQEMLESYRDSVKTMRQQYGETLSSIGSGTTDLLFPNAMWDDVRLCVGTLFDIQDYACISSVRREKNGLEMKAYGGQQSDAYVPVCTVGVLKTAKEQELALDFVRYLLSKDGAVQNSDGGFPVNLAAFESVLYDAQWEDGNGITVGWGSSDGTAEYSLTYSWPTQEELEWLEETAKQLTVCADTQAVQEQVVTDALNRCLLGEIGEDEAVGTIMQSVNLYLAE